MRNPFVSAALVAQVLFAQMRETAIADFAKANGGYTGGNRSGRRKTYSRNYAIPKWARRYSKRYGGNVHHASSES